MDTSKTDDGDVLSDIREQVKKLETRLMAFENHGTRSVIREISNFADTDESVYRVQGYDTELPRHVDYLLLTEITPKARKP